MADSPSPPSKLHEWANREEEIVGRNPNWAYRITSNPDASRFYFLIQELQSTTAFRECHVFRGATVNHVPYVSWDSTVTALPKILLGFLGIPHRRKLCPTHACCNPFHYTDEPPPKLKELSHAPKELLTSLPEQGLESYREMVNFYIDKHDVRTFEELRPLIPEEDISDQLLKQVLKHE